MPQSSPTKARERPARRWTWLWLAAVVALGGCGERRADPSASGPGATPRPAALAASAAPAGPPGAVPSAGGPTAPPAAVPEIVAACGPGRPVIVLGLDGADWQLLDRHVAAGTMPNLARLVAEGTRGELLSEHPPLSPLLWTTMTTGRSPLAHGILDFVHSEPTTGIKEPITSDERRVPALWNLATMGGRRVGVLGLWATFPAEPVAGVLVSDRLMSFLVVARETPAGAVYPPERLAWAKDALARAEASIDLEALRAYLPWLDPATYETALRSEDPYADPVGALRRILVETAVYDALARDLLADDAAAPDLLFAYLQGTDSVGHVFAPYAPPRQPSVSGDDFARFGGVAERYFGEIDRLLGRYRELAARRGAVLLVVSDHGFLWGEGRPERLSSVANTTAAKWHRKEGIYLLWGPEVAAGRGSGGIRQVTATVLALLGLPPGRDVAGPPLPGTPAALVRASASRPPADYDRWFVRPVPRVVSAEEARVAREDLAKLQALGYLGAGEVAPASGRPTTTRSAGSFNNEGLIRKAEGDVDGAVAAFEQAIAVDPRSASALWNLSDLLHTENRDLDQADRLLLRALAADLADGERFVVGRAIGYQRAGDAERALRLLEGAVAARPEVVGFWLFRGRYRIERGDCAGALQDFGEAVRREPTRAEAHASAGLALLCLDRPDAARAAFARSLALDPDQPQVRAAMEGLGR